MKRNSGWPLLRIAGALFLSGMALLAIPAQAQTFAYVTSSSGFVSKIDTASNTVVATIPVGNLPTGLAVTPDGTRVYVANDYDDTVSVIDTAKDIVVATIQAGHTPQFIAITPDGTRAYVTDVSSSVSVIDTASNTVVATIPDGDFSWGIAITPDGTRAYVTNTRSNTMSVIDTASNAVIATIPVGDFSYGVAITPDGSRAYVTHFLSNLVSVIDTASNTLVDTITVRDRPIGVAITPDGTRAYVTSGSFNTSGVVSVIKTATNAVFATVHLGFGASPAGVAITPDGTRAYLTNAGSVSVIDTANNTLMAKVGVAAGPDWLAMGPAKSGTSTSLVSNLNPSIYGQKVTWTAKVTSSGSIKPTGKVTFTWGNTIGTATLNASGVATLTRSNLNADTYPLTAVYSGDANNPGSTSAVLNQVVTQASSAATLTSSPNPSTQGQAVTFTAAITSPTGTAQGPVTFTAGKTVLGTAQLNSGHAKLTISSLAVGSTKVTATYYGDSNIAKSSASVTQTVH